MASTDHCARRLQLLSNNIPIRNKSSFNELTSSTLIKLSCSGTIAGACTLDGQNRVIAELSLVKRFLYFIQMFTKLAFWSLSQNWDFFQLVSLGMSDRIAIY